MWPYEQELDTTAPLPGQKQITSSQLLYQLLADVLCVRLVLYKCSLYSTNAFADPENIDRDDREAR